MSDQPTPEQPQGRQPSRGGQTPDAPEGLAAAYRRIREKAEAAEPTIPLPLPSGAIWRVKRPKIETWLMGGRMPQHLMMIALQMAQQKGNTAALGGMAAALASDISNQDAIKILIFARELVQAAVASPKIVILESGRHFETGELFEGVRIGAAELSGEPIVRPQRAGELSADEIWPDDFWTVFGWASKGAKGIPILTGGGETTLDRVETFRPGDQRGSSSGAGAHGAGVGVSGVESVYGGNKG